MAYSSRGSRFNLLLLEDGEYYLEDVIATYSRIPPGKGVKFSRVWGRRQKGRLKLCTHSVFFVPNDVAQPISKFCFRKIDDIVAASSLFSESDASSGLVLTCSEILQMKADNEVGPYDIVNCDDSMTNPKRHLISLVHTDLKPFLEQLNELYGYVSSGNLATLHRNVISARHVTKFDISYLADYTERPLLKKVPLVSRVSPMINCPGCLNLTDSYLYFQPAEINNIQKERITKFALGSILRIYKRRYMLRQCALELVMEDGKSVLFVFEEIEERDEVHDILLEQPRLVMLERQSPVFMTQQLLRWQRGEMSNFDYLMHLNSAADRSFNDLTQYPVMPWVLSDFKSATLDLDDPASFRDLSKPIGALNPDRLRRLLDRFREMPKDGQPPPFLYGTHYSTPGYVLNFLVREYPEYMLCLQNGKFDSPDRLFIGIADCWRGVMTNPSDVKELIPQFYDTDDSMGTMPGRFLRNSENLDLGRRQNGERVGDVVLPPWASSATDFIKKMREALESDYVSENLHNWIDLIFGYKQTGPEAEKANNLFYYMT